MSTVIFIFKLWKLIKIFVPLQLKKAVSFLSLSGEHKKIKLEEMAQRGMRSQFLQDEMFFEILV
jgi:hypothetical protein